MEWPLVGREAELSAVDVALSQRSGIAILGAAGAGKSRILDEIARSANRDRSVVRVFASEAAASVPFGAFVDLVPQDPTEDRLGMLGAALQSLDDRREATSTVLIIDDAHHLDPLSVAFVVMAAQRDGILVMLSIRTGEPVAEDLAALWSSGKIARLDVAPLRDDDISNLIGTVHPEVGPQLSTDLIRVAQGNPLVLRELLESVPRTKAPDTPLITEVVASPRLVDLVAKRLDRLSGDVRLAMDVVSVGNPIPLIVAGSAFESPIWDELQAGGFVEIDETVRPSHPLYGEVLRQHLNGLREKAALKHLVDASINGNTNRVHDGVDPVRVALWQRACGEDVDSSLAVAGAEMALHRHDPVLAYELAESVIDTEPSAAIVVGRALSYQNRHEESEQAFADAAARIGPDASESTVMALAIGRAQNLTFGLHRPADASSVLAEAIESIQSEHGVARLRNENAVVLAAIGDLSGAIAECRSVVSVEGLDDVTRCASFVTLTVALTMLGDADGTLSLADEALQSAIRSSDQLPFALGQIGIMVALAKFGALRVDEAAADLEALLAKADGPARAMLGMTLASTGAAVGDITGMAEVAHRAAQSMEAVDPFGMRAMAVGVAAILDATSNCRDDADYAQILSTSAHGQPRVRVWTSRGKAWAMHVGGDTDAAVAELVAGAETCQHGEHLLWAALCLHDVVRMGRAELVVDALEQLSERCSASLVAAMASHARGLVDSDAAALLDVSGRFARGGAHLLAAEAAAGAATAFLGAGMPFEAARCDLARARSLNRCVGAATPPLDAPPAVLTQRELEVALDAESGMASRSIAEARFISPRTVDNHLRSVYQKLGVGGRDQLSDIVADLP